MTTENIFDQIKADREAGTPGDWVYKDKPFTEPDSWAEEFWVYGPETDFGRNSFAHLRYGCEEAQEEGDLEANARRIARVPQLEKIALAAHELMSSLDELISESHGVYGLHLSGDLAPWSEITSGGRFEEWLEALETLREATQ